MAYTPRGRGGDRGGSRGGDRGGFRGGRGGAPRGGSRGSSTRVLPVAAGTVELQDDNITMSSIKLAARCLRSSC